MVYSVTVTVCSSCWSPAATAATAPAARAAMARVKRMLIRLWILEGYNERRLRRVRIRTKKKECTRFENRDCEDTGTLGRTEMGEKERERASDREREEMVAFNLSNFACLLFGLV